MNTKIDLGLASVLIGAIVIICPSVESAELLVPGQYATLIDAFNASQDDDTIRITDSGIYEGGIDWNKRVNLVADANVEPTIEASVALNQVIRIASGSADAKIGSADGGRIIIDGKFSESLTSLIATQHGSGHVTIENIMMRGGFANGGSRSYIRPGSGGDATFHGVWIDCLDQSSASGNINAIRLEDMRGNTINLNKVKIINQDNEASIICLGPSHGTVNIEECDIDNQRRAIYNRSTVAAPEKFTFNITRSWLKANTYQFTAYEAIRIDAQRTVVNMSHSLIHSRVAGGQGFYLNLAAGADITLDHCDIVSDNGRSVDIRTVVDLVPEPRTFTLKNCNIFGTGINYGFSAQLLPGDTVVNDYNNHFSLTPYEDCQPAAGPNCPYYVDDAQVGPNDIPIPGLNPGYPDLVGGDVRYTNQTLLVSDEVGEPIGSNLDFSEIANLPGPPPPPNNVGNWNLY